MENGVCIVGQLAEWRTPKVSAPSSLEPVHVLAYMVGGLCRCEKGGMVRSAWNVGDYPAEAI